MIKPLIKHGNSQAIIVDKSLLEMAGLSDSTLFQISVNPSGGLTIQSVSETNTGQFHENFQKLNQKYKKLMKNLADL